MMYQKIALADIAQPVTRTIDVLPGNKYRTIGVKWWGEGAYERQTIDGSQTAAKTLSLVKKNDLIINKIWVRHGSIAIANDNVDGCAASNEFPMFSLDPSRVLPRWLHWLTKTKSFWDDCDQLSHGTSGKNRIKPELFLTITIPLPPLEEQRRIIARIEELAGKIEEARGLQNQSKAEASALFHADLSLILKKNESNKSWFHNVIPYFAELNPKRQLAESITPTSLVSFVPMAAVDDKTGKIQEKQTKQFLEVSHNYTMFKENDVLFARITPCMQNGKAAIATNLSNGIGFGSTEFHVLRPKHQILSSWLHLLVRHKEFRDDAQQHMKGTAGQQRVPQDFFQNKIIHVPPLEEQRNLVQYFNNISTNIAKLKNEQEQATKELDTLLPAILDKAFKGEL